MNASIDISKAQIETDRLRLRPWHESDLNDLYRYASVDGVGEMAGWIHHASKSDSYLILTSFIAHKKTFAIVLKETGQVVGSLGIEELNTDEFDILEARGRELGYVLAKEHWGRGLMTEAVQAVMDYCFHQAGCDFLTCGHFARNDRSRRVIEKCGFRYLKDTIYHTRYGTTENAKLYVKYSPEYAR